MNVCVDIQAAITQRAGVGRYTKSLVEHLGLAAKEDRLKLFYFDFKRNGIPFHVKNAEQKAVRWCPGRVVQKAWKTLQWPPYDWFAGPADLYHFPNFIRPPLTKGLSVVTIHDVSFLRLPETTEARNLAYLTSQIRQTVDRADAIITDSAFSACEIHEQLNVAEDRLFPIHLGLFLSDFTPAAATIAETLVRLRLERPYLLFLGTLEPRKNIPFLIETYEQLDEPDIDLVIAGMQGWKYEPILERMAASPKADRIHYLKYVPDEFLPSLYAGAELFVFPSLYEGFGFPPLEAMACGTPVISSPAGSLAEVLGNAAELVEGYDAADWAARIKDLLHDSERRSDLRKRGLAHIEQYTWTRTAERTWDVYRKVAG